LPMTGLSQRASTGGRAAVLLDRQRAGLEQLVAIRDRNGLRARLDAELHVDVLDVRTNGLGADDHQPRDVIRRQAGAEEPENLELSASQAGGERTRRHELTVAEQALHAREQLVLREGLRDVVVRAEEQPRDAV